MPPVLPLVLFVAVLTLSYGFEVFSFGLTLDEERYGELDNVAYAAKWLEERRWTMSVITLMIPSAVVPVVSTGLGVALSGVAWWLLARRDLAMTPWQALLACSLAGSLPVLAFIFSFSTIAMGIGIGNCLLVVYLRGLTAKSWLMRGSGVLAGAAAVGIYDSFLVALAALSLAYVLKNPKLSSVWIAVGAPTLALLATRLFATLASLVFGIPFGAYIDRYLGGETLLENPVGRVFHAVAGVVKVIILWEESFGLHSPWLALALAMLTILAMLSISVSDHSPRIKLVRFVALSGLMLLPILAGLSSSSVPLRSMLYLPIITLILASVAFHSRATRKASTQRVAGIALSAVIFLAVVGNATISNRLFASAQTAYALDVQLASLIGIEKDKLMEGDQRVDLALTISGRHSWPEGKLTPKAETLGASFFDWDGDDQRAGAFLRMHGVRVHEATPEQVRLAQAELSEMPPYPLDGWVRVSEGILLIKFAEQTL